MRLIYAILICFLALMTLAQCQQTAEDWFYQGVALEGQAKYDEAIQSFDEAIRLDPVSAEAWYQKGNALVRQARYADAATTPDVENGKVFGKSGYQRSKFMSALQAYNETIKLDPEHAAAQVGRGIALEWVHGNAEALQAYEEAIRLDPDYADAWYYKCNTLFYQSKYDDAIIAYDEVIRLDPEFALAWAGRGSALEALGRHAAALQAYDGAINLSPWYVDAWNSKGRVLYSLGRTNEAEEAILRASLYQELVDSDSYMLLLNNPDWHDRRNVSVGLGEIGDPNAIEPLLNLVRNDENEEVRKAAAQALDRIVTERVIYLPGRAIVARYPF